MSASALILGCAGTSLSAEEIEFFRDIRPWGFILFKRNCDNPAQIRALTAALRDCVGRLDAPILIDQEGGRVQRLKPPHWPVYPAGRQFGRLHEVNSEKACAALYGVTRLIAEDLAELGINVDCLPLLDIPVEGAHDVIGDRAYGFAPEIVSTLGRIACEALLDGGVLPVIKHIPGHGRAGADSHLSLPVVDTSRAVLDASDFKPFAALADMPLAMTAHVVYSAIDPDAPATTSSTMLQLIRQDLGYDGLIMTDDLSMKALDGSFADRMRASMAAGCDVGLHCNGDIDEMRAVVSTAPALAGDALRRANAATARLKPSVPFDRDNALALLAELIPESV